MFMPIPLSPKMPQVNRIEHRAFVPLLALAGLLAAGPAAGVEDTACAAFAALNRQPGANGPDQWLGALGNCQNDASFLAALGDLLNQQGRYPEASEHLERALLLNPDLKGAQLSYAIALAGIGDTAAAEALIEALLADPGLPTHLRHALLRQQDLQRTPLLQTRFTVNARWGHDSNLLSAPNLTDLELSLSGQSVTLPLDPSYLASPGQYYRTDAQFDLRRLQPNGTRWDFSASLHNRHSPAEALAGATQADLTIERSTPALNWGHYISATASALNAQSGVQLQALSLAGGVIYAKNNGLIAACRLRTGLEMQSRNYKNNDLLSARYTGLVASVACEPLQGAQWLLGLKAGQDQPDNPDRPGGSQRQYSLRAVGVWPLGRGLVSADIEASSYQDATGYSPLLGNGQVRSMARLGARLEYQQRLTPNLYWSAGLEAARQTANISLFQLQSTGAYLAWRASW
ncbi:MAG: tetratricopeptide repeat protein [Rhodoferax sp.]|nr:tetratricopeptide repeat protein [Rhodoferax sp.]